MASFDDAGLYHHLIVLPKARAKEIIAAAQTAPKTEKDSRCHPCGMDPQQACLKYGKF